MFSFHFAVIDCPQVVCIPIYVNRCCCNCCWYIRLFDQKSCDNMQIDMFMYIHRYIGMQQQHHRHWRRQTTSKHLTNNCSSAENKSNNKKKQKIYIFVVATIVTIAIKISSKMSLWARCVTTTNNRHHGGKARNLHVYMWVCIYVVFRFFKETEMTLAINHEHNNDNFCCNSKIQPQ